MVCQGEKVDFFSMKHFEMKEGAVIGNVIVERGRGWRQR